VPRRFAQSTRNLRHLPSAAGINAITDHAVAAIEIHWSCLCGKADAGHFLKSAEDDIPARRQFAAQVVEEPVCTPKC